MRSFVRVVLVVLLATGAAAPGRGQGTLLDPITRGQGSPSDYVSHLVQDRQGFFWLATDAGLVRYDGRTFVTWTTAEGLPHNYVNTLLVLPDGRLIVGTYRGAALLDRGRLRRIGPSAVSIMALAHDRFGRLYLVTVSAVFVCERGACRPLPESTGAVNRGLTPTLTGDLVLSLSGGRQLRLHPTAEGVRVRVETLATPSTPASSSNALPDACSTGEVAAPGVGHRTLRLPDGTCLSGAPDGVVWQRAPDGRTEAVGRDATGGFPVYSLMRDYEGHVWVALFGGGVWRIGRGALRLPGREDPPLAQPILRLTRDLDGTVWMSTRNGLVARDAQGRVRTLPMRELAVTQPHPAGGHYRATATTLTHVAPTGRSTVVADEGNWFSSLLLGPGDTLWTGSYGSGLRRFAGNREVGLAAGGPEIVEALVGGAHGAVWALTRSEGAFRHRGGRWTQVRDGLPSGSVYSLLDDADGTLWLGTDRGLVRRRGTQQRVFDDRGHLHGQRLHALFRTSDTLWVVADRTLYGVVRDSLHRFGRVRLRPDESVALHAALPLPAERRLLLGTSAGLVEVDLRGAGSPLPPPRVAFLGLPDSTAHGPVPDTLRLHAGQRSLSLVFAPLTFGTGPGRLQHRISDGPWSEPTPERTVALAGLADGWHTVEVRAVNAEGRVTERPVRVSIYVPPPWWRTAAARALALALLLGLVAWSVRRVSTRRLRARLRALETERRVQSERDRISRDLHDHVGAQLTGVLAGLDLLGDEAPEARSLIGALRDEVRETMGALRTTLLTLQHPPGSFDALGALLCRYVRDQMRFRTEPVLRCHVAGEDARPIDPYAALHVFHVAQEALQNAIRHAAASAIDVHLSTDGQTVTLAVSDDGAFVTPDGTGHGLVSMQARADEIGAPLTLDGSARGTTVRLVWTPGARIVRTDDARPIGEVVS